MTRRKVHGLGPVGAQVVKFPRILMIGHLFPVPDADGAIVIVIPPKIIVSHRIILGKTGARLLPGPGGSGFAA